MFADPILPYLNHKMSIIRAFSDKGVANVFISYLVSLVGFRFVHDLVGRNAIAHFLPTQRRIA